jgi:hypothetical protein
VTLFSDPAVVEAGTNAACRHHDKYPDQIAEAILAAAEAALDREWMKEISTEAIGSPLVFTDRLPGESYEAWQSRAVLVAIGLIPEHVTATEER